jgi:hypothetical protein
MVGKLDEQNNRSEIQFLLGTRTIMGRLIFDRFGFCRAHYVALTIAIAKICLRNANVNRSSLLRGT